MSPLWGLGLLGLDISINMSPLWGYVGSLVDWRWVSCFPFNPTYGTITD